MLYFLSSNKYLNENILSNFNFIKGDKIFIFNKKNKHIINLILNYLDKKYDFKIDIIWCQRETVIESLYRGSSSPFIYNKRFK